MRRNIFADLLRDGRAAPEQLPTLEPYRRDPRPTPLERMQEALQETLRFLVKENLPGVPARSLELQVRVALRAAGVDADHPIYKDGTKP